MKKIIRLTESDLNRIVKRVVNETKETPDTKFNKKLVGMINTRLKNGNLNSALEMAENADGMSGVVKHLKNAKSEIDKAKDKLNRLTESRDVKPLINEFWGDSWAGGSINGERGTYYTWASSNGYYNYRDKKWIYSKIESCNNATHIYMLILHSKLENSWWGGFGGELFTKYASTEAVAEAAFMALSKNPGWYGNVKNKLGEDPYEYCEDFMNTSKVYHKQSINTSYNIIKKKNPKLT